MPPTPRPLGRVGRRDALRIGGVTIAGGAVLAACGKSSAEGPLARVGIAPTTTALPAAEVNDAVLLRTAASIELSVAKVYEQLDALGLFPSEATEAVTRLHQDHLDSADAVNALVVEAGGDEWTCSNPRFDEVVVAPILQRIKGEGTTSDGTPIEASDDPTRDALNTVHALETLASATYQSFVSLLADPQLRMETMGFGEQVARHAAVLALIINPDEPVKPDLTAAGATTLATTTTVGEATGVPTTASTTTTTVATEETTAILPAYAVPAQYGGLGVIQLVVGKPNAGGARYTANIETPSLNSYAYEYLSCPA